MIRNPILPGFNPDPSICRVGDDYYIATSTFEWFPGVQIHHSRDLVHWTLVTRPLRRAAQLDMRGDPDSCGIWAPDLSHDGNRFWLIYTDVKRYGRTTVGGASGASLRDFHNSLVTCDTIDGDWSDPVHVNSSGFDPALFHDTDGRKWVVNQLWDHRPGHGRFAGIVLQEYCGAEARLVGERVNIFPGTALGLTEAPHLYRRGDWYYLLTAEGGTGWNHAVTMARSRDIAGPYELHPETHLITSKDAPEAVLQRSGHGQYVETPDGEVYHTHLCSRPLQPHRRSPLGRETSLQRCVWKDDWLYLAQGGVVPDVDVPAPTETARKEENPRIEYRFDAGVLADDFQWLRTPQPERIFSLSDHPGHLRLFGRESIGSWFEQALVARRQEHHRFRAETVVEFEPDTYQQVAGLTHYYNRHKLHAVAVTLHEKFGRVVTVLSCPGDFPHAKLTWPAGSGVAVPDGPVHLAMEVHDNDLQFYWREASGNDWQPIGPALDAGVISDEGGRGEHGSFTGAFVGMFAFDTSGRARSADFGAFSYERKD